MARLADFTRYDQISTFIKRIILGSAVRILNGTFRNKSGRCLEAPAREDLEELTIIWARSFDPIVENLRSYRLDFVMIENVSNLNYFSKLW